MVRCRSKNGHHKDIMCLKKIGVCAQNLSTSLGSIVNIMVGGGATYIIGRFSSGTFDFSKTIAPTWGIRKVYR